MVIAAAIEGAGKPVHLERLIPAESSSFQETRSVAGHVGVADQIVVEGHFPCCIKAQPALSRQFGHGVPPGVVLRNEHHRGPDHPQRTAPFSQELLSKDIGVADRTPIRVERVVAVNRLSQVHAQPIDVHFLDQEGGAADELLAHNFFPKARRVSGRAVVEIAAIREPVIRRAPFIPVINVPFGSGRVVLPLGALHLIVIMIVDYVLNDGDAPPVALAHEMAVFVAAPSTGFDTEVVTVAIAPSDIA